MRFSVFALSACLPVLLAGCLAFTPEYNEVIFEKLGVVGTELTRIETLIETRAPQPVAYSSLEPLYISALAAAKEAQDLVRKRPAYLRGQPAAHAAELHARNIEDCWKSIESSRNRLARGARARDELLNLEIIKNTCDKPKTMEAALK